MSWILLLADQGGALGGALKGAAIGAVGGALVGVVFWLKGLLQKNG